MEPTPIFAALAAPPARGDQGERRTLPEVLRALRAEQDAEQIAGPAIGRGRVGHVPGLLSFRPGR